MTFKKSRWILILSSGFFLSFVLYIYEAFGIEQGISFSGHSLLIRSILFGCGVSLTYLTNELFISNFFIRSTFFEKLLWLSWEIWTASLTTFLLFNIFWNFTELYWSSYFLLLLEFTAVMMIPHLLHFLISENSKKPNFNELIVFKSENGKEEISVTIDRLMYIKAEDNYVKIVSSGTNTGDSRLIRQKLSVIETEVSQLPFLKRVHRSFIANTQSVIKVEKKGKSATLYYDFGETVPVSEKYLNVLP